MTLENITKALKTEGIDLDCLAARPQPSYTPRNVPTLRASSTSMQQHDTEISETEYDTSFVALRFRNISEPQFAWGDSIG
jgi:hypothetical protein